MEMAGRTLNVNERETIAENYPKRDVEENYKLVFNRLSGRTINMEKALKEIYRIKGRNAVIEKLYSQVATLHNEMNEAYKEVMGTAYYCWDEDTLKSAYEDLKKACFLLRNAQDDFRDSIKKVYGIRIE